MWSKLEEVFIAISETNYQRQGSFAEGETLPSSFFTFWNYDLPENGYYDNKAHKAIWKWNVCFYTNDPSILYSRMDEFIAKAKEKGFIIDGRDHDIQTDTPNYYGRMVKLTYIENY